MKLPIRGFLTSSATMRAQQRRKSVTTGKLTGHEIALTGKKRRFFNFPEVMNSWSNFRPSRLYSGSSNRIRTKIILSSLNTI